MTPTELRLDAIRIDPTLQVRQRLDEDTIEHYRGILHDLPPLLVFWFDDEHWLADGFHRFTAYRREGAITLPAFVRIGTRDEAEEAAIRGNARHGRPLTRREKETAILRLLERKPKLTQPAIAEIVGCTHGLVSQIQKADRVRKRTDVNINNAPATLTYRAIADAPEDDWQALVEASAEHDWTAKQATNVVAEFKNPTTTAERKAELLEGSVPDVGYDDEGELTFEPETVADITARSRSKAIAAVRNALAATGKARVFPVADVVDKVPGPDIDQLLRDIDDCVNYWQEIRRALQVRPTPKLIAGGRR